MDPRYHVAAFREVRLLVSGAQFAHGVCAGAETRSGEGGVQRSNRRLVRRVGGVRTRERGRSGRGCFDQASAHHDADRRRVRTAADNRAAQRRIRLRKLRDQANRIDQFDCDRAVIPASGGVDSEIDEIEPITTDRARRHIGEVIVATKRSA